MHTLCKLAATIVGGLCFTQSFGQNIVNLRPGTPAYNEIVRAAVKRWKNRDEFRVGASLDVVRQYGRWAIVFDRITWKGPTAEAWEWGTVLYYDPTKGSRSRPVGWWRTRQVVSKDAMRILAAARKELPAKFFISPPVKLKLM